MDAGDASAPPKILICRKSGQNPLNLGKICDNPGKNCSQRCLTSENGAQRLQKKMKNFLEVTPRNVFCGRGQICRSKVAEQLFGKVSRNSGKNPSHPQKLAFSYTYERSYLTIFSVLMQWPTVMYARCSSSVEKQINILATFFKHQLQQLLPAFWCVVERTGQSTHVILTLY